MIKTLNIEIDLNNLLSSSKNEANVKHDLLSPFLQGQNNPYQLQLNHDNLSTILNQSTLVALTVVETFPFVARL